MSLGVNKGSKIAVQFGISNWIFRVPESEIQNALVKAFSKIMSVTLKMGNALLKAFVSVKMPKNLFTRQPKPLLRLGFGM